ncbi:MULTISPECIES: hypothetical protein [Catenuloplanes]|uniref:Uncharacterized protein n=1 Tax=Catenuloplanes niger TaxID=587534 RepID=A0AAE4CSU4_9ACTN|nr:hypothetical protein [Catenuloplanes niger]MDR7323395.1 hypothetical protein [Catenuloplanes niger]
MEHLLSTPAALSRCPRCRSITITALDEGIRVRADLIPLPDRNAEIEALLDGRRTYSRLRNNELAYRYPYRMKDPVLNGPIHAQHQCPPRPMQATIFDIGA